MISKAKREWVEEKEKELASYWNSLSLDSVIHIKTKAIKTPYISKDAEEFYAVKVPWRDIPGVIEQQTLQIIRLDKSALGISLLSLNRVESINGKKLGERKTIWKINGSKGNVYTVKLKGAKFECNCPGYHFRKKCRHVEEVKEKQKI